jgi:hypothetical protein
MVEEHPLTAEQMRETNCNGHTTMLTAKQRLLGAFRGPARSKAGYGICSCVPFFLGQEENK